MAGSSAQGTEVSDGPVLSLINKRLRGLRKKLNRISAMEDAVSNGKPLNKEQEEVLRSKSSIVAIIDELDKLRPPLSEALAEEISLAQPSPSDLLSLLYFGSLFDVRPHSDFTATMLTRTHERGCCLTYDYVTDDASPDLLLREADLDSISRLASLLTSRPADSTLSHNHALLNCLHHANLWLSRSHRPLHPDSDITYSALRERLAKIMSSDYMTATPEMKAPVEVAAGNYASFQAPIQDSPTPVPPPPAQLENSAPQFQQDVETAQLEEHECTENQQSAVEEFHHHHQEEQQAETEYRTEEEQSRGDGEYTNQRDLESKDQQNYNNPRSRGFQNQRGGGGGRGFSGGRRGRGARGSSRGGGGGGGPYQNGGRFYDQQQQQQGGYYQRNNNNNYYNNNNNNNNRGGRGGGAARGNNNNNHAQQVSTGVGVGS